MTMLEQRLQSAAQELNEHVETSFVHKPFDLPASHRRLRRLTLAVATAAAFAISILVLAVIAPFGGPGSDQADQTLSSTIPAPAPLPAPEQVPATPMIPVAPAGSSYEWTRVADPDLGGEGSQEIISIRSVGAGLIAVGQDDNTPAVWLSADGLDWQRIVDAAGAFGSEHSPYGEGSERKLVDVVDNGSRLVLLGIDFVPPWDVSPKVRSMAIWVSDDRGSTWTRVPHDEDTFELGNNVVNGVIATESGFMAIGDSIWASSDGETWTRAEAPGASAADAASADTGILLVGTIGPDQGRFREAAWYSIDGVSWSSAGVETEPTTDLYTSSFRRVTRTADGYLALGAYSKRLVWFSPEGFAWTFRGGYEENDGYEREWIGEIAAIGETVVVAGTRGAHVGSAAAIWESTDGGITWTVFDDPDWVFGNARSESFQTSASSILAFGENLIVGGRYGGFDAGGFVTGPHDAAVWIGTPISEEGQ